MEGRDPETGRFLPGNSGFGGRPEGSRNRLGRALLEALEADFNEHGATAIQHMRMEKPADYVRVIAGLLPKEFHVKDARLDGISDAELVSVLATVRSLIAAGSGAEDSSGTSQEAGPLITH